MIFGRRAARMEIPSNMTGRIEEAVEEPSWLLPLVVAAIIGVLSLGFLGYYFAPSLSQLIGRAPEPSQDNLPVNVVVGGTGFRIPANYTRFAYSRRGGVLDRVDLYALLPDLSAYDPTRSSDFQDNSPTSRVLHFELETRGKSEISEKQRFEAVYKRLVTNPDGERGPFGLRHYEFQSDTGYKDEELYVRDDADGTFLVLRCFKDLPHIVAPTCRRDILYGDTLALHYRFKRAQLDNWRDIDQRLRTLVRSFETMPASG